MKSTRGQFPKHYCFVAMPFQPAFKNVWELCIVPALERNGLTAWRGDNPQLGTNVIISDITNSIYYSQLVIADLTGCSPNVMYELGLAHAAKKNVIIITQDEDEIPFNLAHIRCLPYNVEDLNSLKEGLQVRIRETKDMRPEDKPDYFPKLFVLDDRSKKDFFYYKERTLRVEVEVIPSSGDIFFNDQRIGSGSQTIFVNPDASRNTVSAAAVRYYEHHQDISKADLDERRILIHLAPHEEGHQHNYNFEKRLPGWLRYRRRDPHNPVLMRAVAQYLQHVKEYEEAAMELEELLKVAPDWCMAHNQVGYSLHVKDPKLALPHYKVVTALDSDSYVGYYNQACAYAGMGDFPKSIAMVEEILAQPFVLESYCHGNVSIGKDDDFSELKRDEEFGPEFKRLVRKLNKAVLDYNERAPVRGTGVN